ncbi:CGNR zinc finger domain-containing protein [Sphaerisporangium fuscum]|uniref:CGNR zinc finger domain-containing protein n=1 Tax=Sphaerisporangium fuscum TaxID=2835868 RepID=UPI001BDBCC7B|nr:CGNR zinc finger domain-containing protein [Sphaerisporangium fuscum]
MELNGAQPGGFEARIRRLRTGATWLDLVATVSAAYGPSPVERLDGVEALGEWLAAVKLLPEAALTEDDLLRTRDLREALRGLALAVVNARARPDGAAELVNEVLAADRPLGLETDGPARLAARRPATFQEALARIARQAVEQLTGPCADNLRTCDEPECAMLFLDPGGRRRWCVAEVCGVRNRVRAHRRRRRAEA